MTRELDLWKGPFGDEYTARNEITEEHLNYRKVLWGLIIASLVNYGVPKTILEVGAGQGINLQALKDIYQQNNLPIELSAIEPNEKAQTELFNNIPSASFVTSLELAGDSNYDLVFTSGVLIHINPDDQIKTIQNIYRVSKNYIVCIEYFSPELREIKYRGEDKALWSRDYGSLYLDNLPLQCLGYGFAWRRITKLDDLTWWLFRKVH